MLSHMLVIANLRHERGSFPAWQGWLGGFTHRFAIWGQLMYYFSAAFACQEISSAFCIYETLWPLESPMMFVLRSPCRLNHNSHVLNSTAKVWELRLKNGVPGTEKWLSGLEHCVDPQHPHAGSQLFLTPVPGTSNDFWPLWRVAIHVVVHRHTCMQSRYLCT